MTYVPVLPKEEIKQIYLYIDEIWYDEKIEKKDLEEENRGLSVIELF